MNSLNNLLYSRTVKVKLKAGASSGFKNVEPKVGRLVTGIL